MRSPDAGRGAVPGLYLVTHPSGRQVWHLRYRDGRSERTRLIGEKSSQFKLRDARARALKIREQARGRKIGGEAGGLRTVEDLVRWHWINHTQNHCSEQAAKHDLSRINRHIVPKLGHVMIDRLDPADVTAWHQDIRADLSPGTANRCLAVLRVSYSSAVKVLRLVDFNPCSAVKAFPEQGKERFLDAEEYIALRDALEANKDLWLPAIECLRFIALTGCRSSEATQLTWDRVDWRAGLMVFDRHGQSKGGKGSRGLSPQALELLRRQKSWKPPAELGRSGPVKPASRAKLRRCKLVFPSRVGRPLHLRYYWERVRDDAGLPDVRIHDLRHSFASRAIRKGVDPLTLQRLLGHKDLATTNKYVHLASDQVREAAAAATEDMFEG